MKLLSFIFLITSTTLSAQLTRDADRLKNLDYMVRLGSKINCDSTGGSNLEHKICLNKEFQKADSIVNVTYLESLNFVESDSLKKELIKIQTQWVKNRHTQAIIRASGYRGHLLGIRYLSYMLLATQNRNQELKTLSLD
jgi:uncharacterized protein YecT (DUF1311 family)